MRRNFAWTALALLVSAGAAQACGPKCRAHPRRHQAATRYVACPQAVPTPLAYAYPSATPQVAPSAPVAAATLAPAAAVPTYEYPAQPQVGGAYYYTYDNSGKLIIQQWGDWLFRGGKEAGMPRPPLPIVGYLQRR